MNNKIHVIEFNRFIKLFFYSIQNRNTYVRLLKKINLRIFNKFYKLNIYFNININVKRNFMRFQ